MPRFTKLHASTKCQESCKSQNKKVVSLDETLPTVPRAPQSDFGIKHYRKNTVILFFLSHFSYLSLPFSYLGYILGLVIPYNVICGVDCLYPQFLCNAFTTQHAPRFLNQCSIHSFNNSIMVSHVWSYVLSRCTMLCIELV